MTASNSCGIGTKIIRYRTNKEDAFDLLYIVKIRVIGTEIKYEVYHKGDILGGVLLFGSNM